MFPHGFGDVVIGKHIGRAQTFAINKNNRLSGFVIAKLRIYLNGKRSISKHDAPVIIFIVVSHIAYNNR